MNNTETKTKELTILVILIAMCALVASASAPTTPFMIYGYVFYEDGSACDNPTVNITNLNTNNSWSADTNASYNYYQLMLANGTDVNVSEILRFNVTSPNGNQSNITEHTVMQENITDGGIFNFNISLEAPAAQDIISISNCSNLNTAGAVYILTENIVNSPVATKCMNITAENITLDCQGYTIDGTDAGYGVYSNQYNTTVKNCVITNWETGICYDGSNNGLIQNNIINTNSEWVAIYLVSSSNTRITNNTAHSNYDGFFLESSSNNTITENIITNNAGDGLYLCSSSSNNTITNNTANSNSKSGIYIESSSNNNTVYSNKFENNTEYGIYMSLGGAYGANLIYNNLFNNTNNFHFTGTIYTNYWNTTKQTGTRIYADGTEIGGNYWTNATGTGYSDTCTDSDKDGFCDEQLNLTGDGKNIDYLPLSDEWVAPTVVSIADASAPLGGSITVPIMVNNVTNLGSGIINVTYNSSVVHVTGVISGTGNALEVQNRNINNSTGLVRILALDANNSHSGGVIFANVTYKAVGSGGSSTTLNITVGDLTEYDCETGIPHTVNNGTFTIIAPIKPVPSNIGANTTEAGMPILFHTYWSSDVGLANYTFAWNDTGVWENVSFGVMTETGNWSNVTTTLNTTLKTIGWRIYCNDTSGNLNDTGEQILTINDTTPPVPSNISANTTEAGMPVLFSAYWTDAVGLANYTFAWNDTGEWVNDSVVEMTGKANWSNVTKTLNTTLKTIGWRIYANDTSGNLNETGIQILTINDTTPPVLSNASANPSTILNDNGRPRPPGTNISRLNVTITDISGISNVSINLSIIGGSPVQSMTNVAGTNNWTVTTNASSGINETNYLVVNATDEKGNSNISVNIPLTVLRRGDVVRNDAVDVGDAFHIAKYLVGKAPMPDLFVADIVPATGDGKITSGDALYIAKHLAGNEPAP